MEMLSTMKKAERLLYTEMGVRKDCAVGRDLLLPSCHFHFTKETEQSVIISIFPPLALKYPRIL